MKNQKALLDSEWHPAPDIKLAEYTKRYYTNYKGKRYCCKYKNYLYSCNVLDSGELVMTIFTTDKKPLFRSFMTRDALKSQYFEDKKASDSTVSHYLWNVLHYHGCYGGDAKIETDEESRSVVAKWLTDNVLVPLKADESPRKAIEGVQSDIRKREVERRNDKIRKSIDDNMLEIKPVPARLEKWIDDVVLKDSRYILYKYSGRKLQDGTCTHCKAEVKVAGAKNGGYGKCPNCRSKVKYIARGKALQNFTDRAQYTYIQPDKNGFPIFRYFDVERHFYLVENAYQYSEYTDEYHRYFYSKNRRYSWGNFKQTGEYRWCDAYSDVGRWGAIYPYNMKSVFKKVSAQYPHIKYIPITKMLNAIPESLNAHYFYVNIVERPVIEYLAKLKLNRLCASVINGFTQNDYFDATAEKFKDVFPKGITREELRFFANLDIAPREIELYYGAEGVKKDKFEKALELVRNNIIRDSCIKYLKYTSLEKLLKYIESIEIGWNYSTMYRSGDWVDYIEMAEKLKWDLKNDMVLFPRDFREAHNRANDLSKIENARRLDKAVAKQRKSLDQIYRMEGKDYIIRAAANAREIVAEGQTLHHCVGTYADKVARGETGILFMRSVKEPDKPLYTIEVRDGKIIQCRGNRNCAIEKKKEQTFFNRWKSTKFKETERKAG